MKFKDNIWTADLSEIGSLSSKNQGPNIYYMWLIFSTNMLGPNMWRLKKVKTALDGFIKIVSKSNRKLDKL